MSRTTWKMISFIFFLVIIVSILTWQLLRILSPGRNMPHSTSGGSWQLLQKSIGIVSMHMQLLHNDRVVIFDRTNFGLSNLSLPHGKCRHDPTDQALTVDCSAHSVEYDVSNNTFRALMVQTDVWCSSGAAMSDGRLVQTGGFSDGDHGVRIFQPCDGCDWQEFQNGLVNSRWYSSNQLLPDGRQIIIGGREQFNYEFYPNTASAKKAYSFPFLEQTNDPDEENNLYPFVLLNVDGNLFIFANNQSILFDYANHKIVKTYPSMPGGDPRNYPCTGSAVLLPLKNLQDSATEAEVLICGGAPKGSFTKAANNTFVGALNTCGRIKITDPTPQWVMETMPLARVMGDMILLPNGNVLIINGAANGSAGWERGHDPVLHPVLYQPDNSIGSRFAVQNPNTIPRMYHSSTVLLRDGRVLIGGSNPHNSYQFSEVLFPTELSLEAFSPAYLDAQNSNLRPNIVFPVSQAKIGYGKLLKVQFLVTGALIETAVAVTMVSPSFNSHSLSMNQRLLVLGGGNITYLEKATFEVQVMTPGSGGLAPPGYYLLFVIHQDIPSEGIWVQISNNSTLSDLEKY